MARNTKWRDIDGYPHYQISDDGQVKSFKQDENGRILTSHLNHDGYPMITLRTIYGEPVTISIHRLVAIAFIPRIKGKNVVNHKDGNKQNSKVENLEWVTISENIKHAYDKLKINPNGREVEQIKNGVVINVFESAGVASRTTGIDNSSICKVCNGRRQTAGGYGWRYVDGT